MLCTVISSTAQVRWLHFPAPVLVKVPQSRWESLAAGSLTQTLRTWWPAWSFPDDWHLRAAGSMPSSWVKLPPSTLADCLLFAQDSLHDDQFSLFPPVPAQWRPLSSTVFKTLNPKHYYIYYLFIILPCTIYLFTYLLSFLPNYRWRNFCLLCPWIYFPAPKKV